MTVIEAKQAQRYDTAVNWSTVNPLLLEGEIGIESDTSKIKVGDGNVLWNDLPYLKSEPFSIGELEDVQLGSTISDGSALIYNDLSGKWVAGPSIGYFDPNTDPFYDQTTLLLRFNGVPNTSNFLDESFAQVPLLLGGTPVHSNTQVKFGATSIRFNNSISPNQVIEISAGNNQDYPFGSLGLTIDTWLYIETTQDSNQWLLNASWFSITLLKNTATTYYPRVTWTYDPNQADVLLSPTNRNVIPVDTWVHLAVVKDSSSVRIYVNGVRVAIDTSSRATGPIAKLSNQPIRIGSPFSYTWSIVSSTGFKGYLDDFRITKGVARYTTEIFPVPLAEAASNSTTSPKLIYSIGAHSDVNFTTPPTDQQTLVWDIVTQKFKPSNVVGYKINNSAPPSSATSSGVAGEIRYDNSYVYVCTATNTWARTPLTSW